MSWQDEAACRGASPNEMVPMTMEAARLVARQWCRFCPVVQACWDDALATGEREAVRGGQWMRWVRRRKLNIQLGAEQVEILAKLYDARGK